MPDRRPVGKAKRDPYQAMVAAGIPPSEAAASLRVVTDRLGGVEDDGQPFTELEMESFARDVGADVEVYRADWYSSRAVPAWAKRLLDARE